MFECDLQSFGRRQVEFYADSFHIKTMNQTVYFYNFFYQIRFMKFRRVILALEQEQDRSINLYK